VNIKLTFRSTLPAIITGLTFNTLLPGFTLVADFWLEHTVYIPWPIADWSSMIKINGKIKEKI